MLDCLVDLGAEIGTLGCQRVVKNAGGCGGSGAVEWPLFVVGESPQGGVSLCLKRHCTHRSNEALC